MDSRLFETVDDELEEVTFDLACGTGRMVFDDREAKGSRLIILWLSVLLELIGGPLCSLFGSNFGGDKEDDMDDSEHKRGNIDRNFSNPPFSSTGFL